MKRRGPHRPASEACVLAAHSPGFPQEDAKAGLRCLFTALFLVWETRVTTSCGSVSTVLQWVSQCPSGLLAVSLHKASEDSESLDLAVDGVVVRSPPHPGLRSPSLKPHLNSEEAQYLSIVRLQGSEEQGSGMATLRLAAELGVGFEPCSWGSQARLWLNTRVHRDEPYSCWGLGRGREPQGSCPLQTIPQIPGCLLFLHFLLRPLGTFSSAKVAGGSPLLSRFKSLFYLLFTGS